MVSFKNITYSAAVLFLGVLLTTCQKNLPDTANFHFQDEETFQNSVLKNGDYTTYLENLIAKIENLVDTGILSRGNANALISKLSAAIKNFSNDHSNAANGNLNSVVKQLEAFVDAGILELDEGQILIEAAEKALDGDFSPDFTCGEAFPVDRDGYSYETVQIGSQCWLAENLKWLPSVNMRNDFGLTPHYYVYGYNGTDINEAMNTPNYSTYGVLYNLQAAKLACPEGWHLPSNEEWDILKVFLGDNAGFKMKSTTGWDNDTYTNRDGNGNNSSGFNAFPAGYTGGDQPMNGLGKWTGYWTSSFVGDFSGYGSLSSGSNSFNRDEDIGENAMSVRCIQDGR